MIVLSILFYLIGGLLILWFAFCALLWLYWFTIGHKIKNDKSGDVTIGIFLLPFAPFMILWSYLEDLWDKL